MTMDLTVSKSISATPQAVEGQDGSRSGVQLAQQATIVVGQDLPGRGLPLAVVGTELDGQAETYNRILRIQFGSFFFDVGIAPDGTLFVNNTTHPSNPAARILSVTQDGAVTVNDLRLPKLTTAPSGSTDLAVDGQGRVFKQS